MSDAYSEAHRQTIRALMHVIDERGDAATFGNMADAVLNAVEPILHEEGRRTAEAAWPRMKSAVRGDVLADLRMKVGDMLADAKRRRDAMPPEDMRDDPYGYGQRMALFGHVTGLAEVLFGPLDETAAVSATRQEWVIVCDGDPRMDGSYARRQIGGPFSTLENARTAYHDVVLRSKRDPKANLRIERRIVGEWEVQP